VPALLYRPSLGREQPEGIGAHVSRLEVGYAVESVGM